MKKVVKLLVVLMAVLIVGTAFGARDVSAATDKLMEKYFPNGIEKIKPIKPTIDTREASFIGAIITQTDEVLALARDYEAGTEEVDTGDNYYTEFEYQYGISGLNAGVQFDISVDGGDWQYKKSWDTFEHNAYDEGFCFYEYTGGQFSDNNLVFSLMETYGASEGKLLKNTVRNEKFDLNNHTFKVRYRFFFSYEYIDDYDAGMQYRFTDWSDATSFGKSNEVTVALPDEIPAPDISNPKRELDDDGVWDGTYVSIMTHFDKKVTDAETAIYLNTGILEPLMIVVNAAVDDLTEKKFNCDGSIANAVWMSDGQRGVGMGTEKAFTEDSRILLRAKIVCETLDKESKYDYAVDQVKGLKAKTTKTTSIKLTWSKVDGAEFYEIYSGDNKLLGTSKTNSFTVKKLKSGTGYDFKVRAVADKVLVGLFSETLKTPTKPAKVKISSAKLAKETLTVKYKKVTGSGYEVQIATDKKFKNDLVKLTVKGAAKLKAVQKGLTGKIYYIRVRGDVTYGGKTVYGAWSKVKGAKK